MSAENRILITGASGRTGVKVLRALSRKGGYVRAFVRRSEVAENLKNIGAREVFIGDLFDSEKLQKAVQGCRAVFHICPPMNPREAELAKTIINIVLSESVDHFVLYSVLHPLLQEIPHHNQKLEAERYLIDSGQKYTILQPSRYMQHLTPLWKSVVETGVLSFPFSVASRFSVVDLNDIAEASATVLTESTHFGATYQLAGPAPINQKDMAEIISEVLGRQIRAEAMPLEDFLRNASKTGMSPERIETMRAMNKHYNHHGLIGNSNTLKWLLDREPTEFRDYLVRDLCLSNNSENTGR